MVPMSTIAQLRDIADGERLERALTSLMKEGQRIHDFIERLDHVIEDAVRNAQLRRGPERFK
jgi:hypothetical protein